MGCYDSTYQWVGCVSRSGLMGVVEKVIFGDLHPSVVLGLTWDVRHFFFSGFMFFVCIRQMLLDRFRAL